jgi:chromosomal replication initiation ATPase DnaA
MDSKETILLQEILKSIEVLGITETANALKLARSKSLTLQDKRIEFVLKMVSSYYNITIEEIINSHSKSTKRMFALKFAIFYLYEIFHISFGNLKLIFKRDKSLLSRSTKEIKIVFLNDKYTNSIKNKFDLLVTDFKIQNNF